MVPTTNCQDDDLCAVARCNHPAVLVHLGRPLCDTHWVKLCEREKVAEDRAAAIGAARRKLRLRRLLAKRSREPKD